MNRPDLDSLLVEYRQAGVPTLSSAFSSHVLREIRHRSAETKRDSGWLSVLLVSLRPGMVAASLSVAIAVGILLPGLALGHDHPTVSDGLGLSVFSASAPNLPSGLLTHNR